MSVNDVMEELYLPKLKYIGDNFILNVNDHLIDGQLSK